MAQTFNPPTTFIFSICKKGHLVLPTSGEKLYYLLSLQVTEKRPAWIPQPS